MRSYISLLTAALTIAEVCVKGGDLPCSRQTTSSAPLGFCCVDAKRTGTNEEEKKKEAVEELELHHLGNFVEKYFAPADCARSLFQLDL